MSMTTFYTSASSAAELAEALLLTSSPCETASSTSSSLSVSTSVDEDMMMLDFDVDDSPLPSCLASCVAFTSHQDDQVVAYPFDRRSLDLIHGDSQAVNSAVFCFVKNFVW